MLTRLVESGQLKAHRYWPIKTPIIFGGTYQITPAQIYKTNLDYKIKEFEFECKGEVRKIFQYKYLNWSDHEVPESPAPIIHMINSINHQMDSLNLENTYKSPLLVHCSAGIGRSGTFVAIHSALIKLMKESKTLNEIDIKQLVLKIRLERYGAISKQLQYLFIYDAIEYGLKANTTD